jgi:hypothetical protein
MEISLTYYKAALAYLKEKQCGEAKAALWHPEIGYIDLIWGDYNPEKPNKGWGLKKIIEKHPEVVENLDEIIKSLKIDYKSSDSRKIRLCNETYYAVVSKEFCGNKKLWLLTAYEIEKAGDETSKLCGLPASTSNKPTPYQSI